MAYSFDPTKSMAVWSTRWSKRLTELFLWKEDTKESLGFYCKLKGIEHVCYVFVDQMLSFVGIELCSIDQKIFKSRAVFFRRLFALCSPAHSQWPFAEKHHGAVSNERVGFLLKDQLPPVVLISLEDYDIRYWRLWFSIEDLCWRLWWLKNMPSPTGFNISPFPMAGYAAS